MYLYSKKYNLYKLIYFTVSIDKDGQFEYPWSKVKDSNEISSTWKKATMTVKQV